MARETSLPSGEFLVIAPGEYASEGNTILSEDHCESRIECLQFQVIEVSLQHDVQTSRLCHVKARVMSSDDEFAVGGAGEPGADLPSPPAT
jgi:hypothetical protein